MDDSYVDVLVEKMGDKFTREEIKSFAGLGTSLCERSVLTMLEQNLRSTGTDRGKKAADVAAAMIPEKQGYVQCSFEETPFKLNVCLCVCPPDYVTKIDLPSEKYVADLIEKYEFIKQCTLKYWDAFCRANNEFAAEIENILGTKTLQIDPAQTTTIFLSSLAQRLTVFCYYVDQNGTPWVRKTG